MQRNGAYCYNSRSPNLMSTPRKSVLTGEFRPTLDDKGRFTLPALWRKHFEKEDQFLAIPSAAGYVTILPPAEVDKIYDKFADIPITDDEAQEEMSAFFANTQTISFDSAGRMALSDFLSEHVGLKGPKDEVVLVGVMNKFNVFSTERWNETKAKSTAATQRSAMRRFRI